MHMSGCTILLLQRLRDLDYPAHHDPLNRKFECLFFFFFFFFILVFCCFFFKVKVQTIQEKKTRDDKTLIRVSVPLLVGVVGGLLSLIALALLDICIHCIRCLYKHLVISQRKKAPYFSAFHWSPDCSLVSTG